MSAGHWGRMCLGFRFLSVQNPTEPSIVWKHEPEKKTSMKFSLLKNKSLEDYFGDSQRL